MHYVLQNNFKKNKNKELYIYNGQLPRLNFKFYLNTSISNVNKM